MMKSSKSFINELSSQKTADHYFTMKKIGATEESAVVVNLASSSLYSLQITDQQPQSKIVKNSNKINIMFNNDRCYYTPSFLAQSDHKNLQKKLKSMLNVHNQKQEDLRQKEELFVPKPALINSKCEICKVLVEDYLTHLESREHKQKLCKGEYYTEILNICKRFKPKTKKIFKQRNQICRGISQNQLTEEILNDKISFQSSYIIIDSQQQEKVSVQCIDIE